MTSSSKNGASAALEIKTKDGVKFGKELREKEFLFGNGFLNLNHGSFGTFPRIVRDAMRAFQDECEAQPDPFIIYKYPQYLDLAREGMAKLLNTPSSTLVFVPNATTGINTVLRNIEFQPGDHILIFSTIYGACEKTVSLITETTPAESVKIGYTFPVEDDWLLEEFEKKVKEVENKGGKVKIAVFDTIVSMPGVRMPFERLTQKCKELGVMSCIDGAHGVGHVEIDLGTLDPDFFVSNCHKWLHVPRGCAIFHVADRNQGIIRSTLPTSHGFIPKGEKPVSPFPKRTFAQSHAQPGIEQNSSEQSAFTKSAFVDMEKPAFVANFEFVGTIDNSPYLCVPTALKWRESIGGEDVIRNYCQTLVRQAAQHVAQVLGTEVMENSTGTLGRCCLSNVRLPISLPKVQDVATKHGIDKEDVGIMVRDWMKKLSCEEYSTFIMIYWYGGVWWTRLSGQVYLEMKDFEWAAETLKDMCARAEKGEWAVPKTKL
ncbi:Hercynylcysteine sulfoxide lyase [Alternaria arborescens]|uniref:Hercynylcysteine sulfoxide lyase n=1 Tax=Alternaria arborescens TaxID=156630 RepID=A0A4Q4SGF3_9PLEO|nr:Hercynylcysteine sulfoxide lyase [Alternaria arborescens]RYN32108.1 Hercynylcysteine sulfoxide lyase [Alternaria arborescens]RYO16151.1 Hercynylcysteine sulfoxide lyase [Alternaria arborescens]RYO69501.1 Hercynylcysteine sulfoxide lyase [Alternaria arborescens]